ncbi:hypothetical protein [Genomoviridae sp.]|nr:hypothetical protein [Genomoviridae sp.]
MSSSLTLSLATFLNGPFLTISRLLELSASLDERITLMEVLISMFSAISDERSNPDDPISLMSMATTQTLSHLVDVREKVGTMRQRMDSLLQGAWRGRAEVDFLQLRINGARLSAQKVEKSFLTCYGNWIRRPSSPNGPNSTDTQTPPTPSSMSPMWVPLGSNLSLEWYLSWLDGEENLLRMIS